MSGRRRPPEGRCTGTRWVNLDTVPCKHEAVKHRLCEEHLQKERTRLVSEIQGLKNELVKKQVELEELA